MVFPGNPMKSKRSTASSLLFQGPTFPFRRPSSRTTIPWGQGEDHFLAQCPKHSRHLINVCWLNDWIIRCNLHLLHKGAKMAPVQRWPKMAPTLFTSSQQSRTISWKALWHQTQILAHAIVLNTAQIRILFSHLESASFAWKLHLTSVSVRETNPGTIKAHK